MRDIKTLRAYMMTLDPLHVGTGAYRLSRVDLPVLRDSGTGLPKVPGTSLSGVARAYAAMIKTVAGQPVRCAGQGKHCGTCQVCATFGTLGAEGEENATPPKTAEADQEKPKARAGMVSFFDARLMLFPVASMAGAVWVTSSAALAEAGVPAPNPERGEVLFTGDWGAGVLNLGWLLLKTKKLDTAAWRSPWPTPWWGVIGKHIAVVNDALFSSIVDRNMEVRTSVSIDPETGAAKSGFLFTYEAVPRSAVFAFDLVENIYRAFPPPGPSAGPWESPLEVALAGLALADRLGVGGMGTRGFGRVQVVQSAKAA
ncbi:MAG: RAMP superfamily CRISPR-associated protein [Candidatus Solibacter sp.]|nr:RAMP superfamily CRISPR-associated protein [Candidatus Solibacter sp.]